MEINLYNLDMLLLTKFSSIMILITTVRFCHLMQAHNPLTHHQVNHLMLTLRMDGMDGLKILVSTVKRALLGASLLVQSRME